MEQGGGVFNVKKQYFSPEESYQWLQSKMEERGLKSLEELSDLCLINKGTLSRYFRQERRPSIDMLEPLCTSLGVSPENLLIALGALSKKKK